MHVLAHYLHAAFGHPDRRATREPCQEGISCAGRSRDSNLTKPIDLDVSHFDAYELRFIKSNNPAPARIIAVDPVLGTNGLVDQV